jgi:hypothetical protein
MAAAIKSALPASPLDGSGRCIFVSSSEGPIQAGAARRILYVLNQYILSENRIFWMSIRCRPTPSAAHWPALPSIEHDLALLGHRRAPSLCSPSSCLEQYTCALIKATPSTSIPHGSYQCDGYGNTLYRGNDAMRVARIESQISMVDVDPSDPDFRGVLGDALRDVHPDWVDLDDSVGHQGLLVMVNLTLLQFFTYDQGRMVLTHCDKPSAFARRLAYERNHYEVAQPPYLLFIQDGKGGCYRHPKGVCISGMGA